MRNQGAHNKSTVNLELIKQQRVQLQEQMRSILKYLNIDLLTLTPYHLQELLMSVKLQLPNKTIL